MDMEQDLVKVAAVQAAPVWIDLKGGIEKTVKLIDEAGAQGVKLINFPETWLPGYPWQIWMGPPAFAIKYFARYVKNSIEAGSDEEKAICAAARRNNIHVVMGVSERDGGSLYMAQWHIGPDGQVISRRRKLKPTHVERSVFGEGDGSDMIVNDTELGKIGALCCWEHFQPLSKYSLFAQGEQIHCAAWPAFSLYDQLTHGFSAEVNTNANQTYAMEGQCFVLQSCAMISQEIYDELVTTEQQKMFMAVGGGYSRVFGPDGATYGENLAPTEEGLVIADIDMNKIIMAKVAADPAGHYSRPDALALVHNKSKLRRVLSPQEAAEQVRSSDASDADADEIAAQ
ncbi:carbon-nitrogen hydrolase family protein [Epibacterium ulvae]|uniref:carbon-nitrogen hydrolase family protein n=1 Tax=Epibacterium ulvae TaxID=1156985 RepID=UPI002493663E|nr:carbon-nitrogen hydrolase family protein [Epibacterium ulvae]